MRSHNRQRELLLLNKPTHPPPARGALRVSTPAQRMSSLTALSVGMLSYVLLHLVL